MWCNGDVFVFVALVLLLCCTVCVSFVCMRCRCVYVFVVMFCCVSMFMSSMMTSWCFVVGPLFKSLVSVGIVNDDVCSVAPVTTPTRSPPEEGEEVIAGAAGAQVVSS